MAAATYDLSKGGTTELSSAGDSRMFVIERQIDFTVTPLTTTQTCTLVNIPKDTLLLGVQAYVDTAQTGTIDIGDADTADTYLAVGSLAVAGVTLWSDHSTGTGRVLVPATATRFFTAANDIRIKAHSGSTLTTGKVTVRVAMVKFGA